MRELRDIVHAYEGLERSGVPLVLATVVATRGSTYRKAGARMLMTEHAWLAGAISGGCLEGDLLRKAWWRTAESSAVVVTYDGARETEEGDDDDASDREPVRWGFGLGCDGSVDVLIERVCRGDGPNPLRLLARALQTRRPAVLSTTVRVAGHGGSTPEARVGERTLALVDELPVSNMAQALAEQVTEHTRCFLAAAHEHSTGHSSYSRHLIGQTEIHVFHELVLPPRPLVIFGNNYDALPLARCAHELGWDVTLVAHKAPFSTLNAQFSAVARVVMGRVPEVLEKLTLAARSTVVVMTHNYTEDMRILGQLLTRPLSYLGMLGPARRTTRMLRELMADGQRLEASALARVHAPVGLDLGASTPEEIALSILAEAQAVATARTGKPLRDLVAAEAQLTVSCHQAGAES